MRVTLCIGPVSQGSHGVTAAIRGLIFHRLSLSNEADMQPGRAGSNNASITAMKEGLEQDSHVIFAYPWPTKKFLRERILPIMFVFMVEDDVLVIPTTVQFFLNDQ